jgi:hypothetical protein
LSIALLIDRYHLRKQLKHDQFFSSKQNKTYIEQLDSLDQLAKHQSLIDCWSKISKSYELNVKILELNTEGQWKPVQVKLNSSCQTGGLYQLKQGQSRQISVTLGQTKPNSVMWYNGMLFNVEAHKIDKISVGSILVRDINLNVPLDSYQEVDLNKLREKCRRILENRKQYLYAQLQDLSDPQRSDEDKERHESLCKQLMDLGEEQASIDAPSDNSHLPGSTIQWQPEIGNLFSSSS